jgi:MSHA biogenesis protein MshP
MVGFSNTQQLNSAQDVQGSRAYWSARAGLEWGLASVNSTSACPAASTTLTIEGFTVVVACSVQPYVEGIATPQVFRITSIASAGTVGSIGFIERSVTATLEF